MSHSSSQTAGFCVGSVHGNMKLNPDVQVSCEMFKVQVKHITDNKIFFFYIIFFLYRHGHAVARDDQTGSVRKKKNFSIAVII